MHSGALREVISIEEETESKNATSGQTQFTFAEVLKLRAHVKPFSMTEGFQYASDRAATREICREVYVFTVRYCSLLATRNSRYRIVWNERHFDIIAIAHDMRRQWTTIRAESFDDA